MKALLKERLEAFVLENYPHLLHLHKGRFPIASFSSFIEDETERLKPLMTKLLADQKDPEAIIEACLADLVKKLGPSKSSYVKTVLREEFPTDYASFDSSDVLSDVVIQLVQRSESTFESFDFNEETCSNHLLRHAIIVVIHDYLHD